MIAEFEGLGVGDVNSGVNGSNTDEDMHDLFRSFLVESDDLLPVSSQGNHSGSSHAAAASAAELPPPAGFCLRVAGSNAGGGDRGGGGGGYDVDGGGLAPARRRANTSPECDDIGSGSSLTKVWFCCWEDRCVRGGVPSIRQGG